MTKWVRCGLCLTCYPMYPVKNSPYTSEHWTYGCRVCEYRFYKESHTKTLERALTKRYRIVMNKIPKTKDHPLGAVLHLMRNTDPMFVDDCYREALYRFKSKITDLWVRSLLRE